MGTLFKRSDRGGRGGKWYAEFTDVNGERIKKCTNTRDKRAANDILSAWETEIAKQKAGLADPHADRLREQVYRPITEHLSEYIDSLKSAGDSEEHRNRIKRHCNAVIDHGHWQTLRDVTSESLEKFLVSLKDKDRSARTIGSYIQSVRGFVKWAYQTHRSPINPLAHQRKPNPQTDRRLHRRMILPNEWPWLMKAITGPRYGVPAADRRILYEFAVQTALRSSEIRSLVVADIDLVKNNVMVRSTDTKDSEPALQHFTTGLAKKLSEFIRGRAGDEPLFTLCNPTNMARMIQADCEAARDAWLASFKTDAKREKAALTDFLAVRNHKKQSLDFHSLRHTCGAWLAIQGVHPKTMQAIMRHSTITLTLDTYGHLMPGAEPEAIGTLESIFKSGESNG